jgi:glycosyltransferase involved in cell wall biosynthesis
MEPIKPKGILIISPFFAPNIGGAETHLSDLTSYLASQKIPVFVHTYLPQTTLASAPLLESKPYLTIYRHPIFIKNIFHRVEKYPLLDFLYLTPLLFIYTFLWMISNHSKISTIHSHGLNAAFIGSVLALIFGKHHLTSTHAVYENLPSGFGQNIIKSILNSTKAVLALSNSSIKQLKQLGINYSLIHRYHYWIDTGLFKPSPKYRQLLRKKYNYSTSDFVLIFVGRLIPKKGAEILCQIASKQNNFKLMIIGDGPDYVRLKNKYQSPNIEIIGNIDNHQLYKYYSAADLFCLPSQYPEGFGRSTMEAVACGLPAIVTSLGSAHESVDESVAIIVPPTQTDFSKAINFLISNPKKYQQLNFTIK